MSSFRPHHDFKDGANVLGAQLATCDHCKTTRVTEPTRHAQPRYIRPGVRDDKPGDERDSFVAPPCIAPMTSTAAASRVAGMNAQRRRDAALRAATQAAPREVAEAERRAPPMLTHFPWFADMQR